MTSSCWSYYPHYELNHIFVYGERHTTQKKLLNMCGENVIKIPFVIYLRQNRLTTVAAVHKRLLVRLQQFAAVFQL